MTGGSVVLVALALAAWTFASEWLIHYLERSGFMERVGGLDVAPRALMMAVLFTVAFPALVVGVFELIWNVIAREAKKRNRR